MRLRSSFVALLSSRTVLHPKQGINLLLNVNIPHLGFCQRRSHPLFSIIIISKVAGFLDIILFKKLFEYTQHSVLSSLAPLRNSELTVVLAVVLAIVLAVAVMLAVVSAVVLCSNHTQNQMIS